jgi:hypothetical protein
MFRLGGGGKLNVSPIDEKFRRLNIIGKIIFLYIRETNTFISTRPRTDYKKVFSYFFPGPPFDPGQLERGANATLNLKITPQNVPC